MLDLEVRHMLRTGKPTGLGGGLTSDLGEGVLGKTGIENGVRDLVTAWELRSERRGRE